MLFLISLAFAQSTDSAQSEIIIPKVEEHDFEGVEIDGVIYKFFGLIEQIKVIICCLGYETSLERIHLALKSSSLVKDRQECEFNTC